LQKDHEEFLLKIERSDQFKILQDLYEKGWFITSGTKYGADLALYKSNAIYFFTKDDPITVHANSLVFFQLPQGKNIVEINRIATITKKLCILASVEPRPIYTYIQRDALRQQMDL
jgi:tRNA splicing endonuclease